MSFNTRIAKSFAFAAGTLLLSSLALAKPVKFERDGIHYTYEASVEKGHTVLTGTADDGTRFRLVVKGDRVTGSFGRSSVDFKVAEPATAVALR